MDDEKTPLINSNSGSVHYSHGQGWRTGKWASTWLSRLMTKPTKWLCAQRRLRSALASAQSDQSLSEYSLCAQWVAKGPRFLHADSEDSDQTGRMPRLIWVFTWRTCHFVGFIMWRRLMYKMVLIVCMRTAKSQGSMRSLTRAFAVRLYNIWSSSWENLFYAICEQQRRRSACTSAQFTQHLCCSLSR